MSQQLATVKVKANSERGWRIINQSAFDPGVHQLFEDAPEPAVIEAPAVEPEAAIAPEPASDPSPKRGPGRPKRSQ